jgi:hypothetical protein
VRSFKAFLLIDVLFLVACLFALYVEPMIDASRVNVVREASKSTK